MSRWSTRLLRPSTSRHRQPWRLSDAPSSSMSPERRPGAIGRTAEKARPAPVRAADDVPTFCSCARRHRLRSARLLRQPDRNSEPGQDRRRAAVQQHAHDGVAASGMTRATTRVVPFESGFLSARCSLPSTGYSSFMVGKWHLTPSNQETAARPQALQPLPLGLDVGRQHPVPPLEARATAAAPATPSSSPGRRGSRRRARCATVGAHHRHGADRARPARAGPSGHDPGRHPVAVARRQVRQHPRRSRGGDGTTTPSTSKCSVTGRSTTTAGGAVCPWPGPSFTEAGKGFGEPISTETLPTLDATGWSCIT